MGERGNDPSRQAEDNPHGLCQCGEIVGGQITNFLSEASLVRRAKLVANSDGIPSGGRQGKRDGGTGLGRCGKRNDNHGSSGPVERVDGENYGRTAFLDFHALRRVKIHPPDFTALHRCSPYPRTREDHPQ